MQDTPQPQLSPIKKRIAIICGVILVLVGIAAITVVVLKNIIPKKEAATSSAVINADEVVALYSVPGAVKGLAADLYDQQLDDGMSVPLRYKLTNRNYIVSTPTTENVLFYSKSTEVQKDTKAIQDQTTVFMHDKGYEKVATPATARDEVITRVTYASERAVCQLTSSAEQTPEGSPASHQLACAQNAVIDAEYAEVDKLLELYAKNKATPTFTEAVRFSTSEDNKAYAMVSLVTTQKRSPNLLFAAVNDDWAYVGDLNGAEGEDNSKYVISADVKAKISDPKYGEFLTRNLLGQSSTAS
jgi:hypothetical protein